MWSFYGRGAALRIVDRKPGTGRSDGMWFVRCRTRGGFAVGLPIICAMLGAACGDGSESAGPAPRGRIRVVVSMSGVDAPVAYSVLVAGHVVSGTRSSGAVVSGLAPGNYILTLSVLRNCRVDGDNPRAVTVLQGQTTELTFAITCVAATGALRVKAVTTGVDLDPDGYQLRIDGYTVDGSPYTRDWATGANETQILSGIAIGEAHVTLRGVSVNCDLGGEARRTAVVPPADTATVAFTLACAPDTAQVAFVVGTAPGTRYLSVGTATGSRVRRLTADDVSAEDPAWSPDGTKVAFTTDRDGNREIYVIGADGSNQVRLTNDAAADYEPAWSRDGTRIAFVSERTGRPQIFSMNADGSNLVRLTTTESRDLDPAWSPDGRVAFSSNREGHPNIYVMNADGSGQARLTTYGGTQPAWSPDGSVIAYTETLCEAFSCYPSIFTWSSSTPEIALHVGAGERPSWSPDGRKIAFGGLHCNFPFDYDDTPTCEPDVVRIVRLDRAEVIPMARGAHPAWRP